MRPTRLHLSHDGARSMFVAGSFNGWKPDALPLLPNGAGGWEIDLFLPHGDYEYRFIADGEWMDDPMARDVVANPFGSFNAILRVSV